MKKVFFVSSSSLLNSLKKINFQKTALNFFNSASFSPKRFNPLYKVLSPIGNPDVSVVPVLDKWIKDGKFVDKPMLVEIISELKKYKRFTHALEVSEWMTDKRYIPLNVHDIAMRINLIFKVHGLEQVENYFSNIPQRMKIYTVQLALLNCYAQAKSVDKAEAVMQKTKDMGYFTTSVWYNVMMSLYCNMGNWEKLNSLVDEMEAMGIHPDRFTLSTRLKAYTLVSDLDGIENVVNFMESDPKTTLDWNLYGNAATGYLEVGSTDKALEMLQKMELLMEKGERKDIATVLLLQLYSRIGKKDELYRIWKKFKETNKVYNNVYRSMLSSLMKLEDLNGVESIFAEWESSQLSYDFRVVNYMIDVNCRKGDLEKAEALLSRGTSLGVSPNIPTWSYLAGGYIMENELAKAIDALKAAISLSSSHFVPTSLKTQKSCLEYLEKGNNMDEFVRSLNPRCFRSSDVLDKLVCFIETGELPSRFGSPAEEDDVIEDELIN